MHSSRTRPRLMEKHSRCDSRSLQGMAWSGLRLLVRPRVRQGEPEDAALAEQRSSMQTLVARSDALHE